MATIRGIQTIKDVQVLSVTADPNTGGGTSAPIGSLALASGIGVFQKRTSSATGWFEYFFNGGSGEIFDTGGGNFIFDAQESKQGYANLVAGSNYIYISNIQAGDTYIFELISASVADEVFIIDVGFLHTTLVSSANTTGGGSYTMTASIGAIDRVLVTFDGTNIYVAPIGQDFV